MAGRGARCARALAAVALAAATGSAAVVTGTAAPAAAAATCTAPSVRIMVDFRPHTGAYPTPTWPAGFQGNGSAGNLVTACVTFTSGLTGYSLLQKGGFTLAGTQHDGPAFVCRINNLPAASGNPGGRANEPCSLTPPAAYYWSYWHAKPGQTSWEYSSLGAMSYHSVPGSVEVWEYGPTDIEGTYGQPQFSPQSVMPAAAPAGATTAPAPGAGGAGGVIVGPAPTGSRPATTAPRSSTSATTTAPTGPATASGSAVTSATPGATSSAPTSAGDTSGTAAGSDAPPSSVDIDAIAKPAGVTKAGTPWATIATVIALAVAALVGGGVAWRRKQASS